MGGGATVWIWIDRSPSMAFVSQLAQASKIERATVLGLAAADLLVRGGERVGLLGLTRPLATRGVIERFAEALALDERLSPSPPALPPPVALTPRSKVVLLGDFLSDEAAIRRAIDALSAQRRAWSGADDRRPDRGNVSVRGAYRVRGRRRG